MVIEFLPFRIIKKNNQNTKKQTEHQLQESILLFSGLRDMEEPIRL